MKESQENLWIETINYHVFLQRGVLVVELEVPKASGSSLPSYTAFSVQLIDCVLYSGGFPVRLPVRAVRASLGRSPNVVAIPYWMK